MKQHAISCILCPVSCEAHVEVDEAGTISMSNLECHRGECYVEQELRAPLRDVFTTISITGATIARLPVRTSHPVPKHKVMNCMRALTMLQVKAPVLIGTVIVHNLLDLGIDVIATRTLLEIDSQRK
jgi:CxxC motif-containing protein